MPGTTHLYDPALVIATFFGSYLTEFAKGTFISAERSQDGFTYTPGSGGRGVRTRNPDKSGEVEFTLLQTSPSNDVLSACYAADELLGTGIGPIFIKDLLGTTLVSGDNAWVKKLPAVEYGDEATTRKWILTVENLQIKAGGSF